MTKLELSFQQFLINLATCNGSTSLLTESFDVSINVELSAPLANAVRKCLVILMDQLIPHECFY